MEVEVEELKNSIDELQRQVDSVLQDVEHMNSIKLGEVHAFVKQNVANIVSRACSLDSKAAWVYVKKALDIYKEFVEKTFDRHIIFIKRDIIRYWYENVMYVFRAFNLEVQTLDLKFPDKFYFELKDKEFGEFMKETLKDMVKEYERFYLRTECIKCRDLEYCTANAKIEGIFGNLAGNLLLWLIDIMVQTYGISMKEAIYCIDSYCKVYLDKVRGKE